MNRQWMSLFFDRQRKVTKRKLAAGYCCFELPVVGQGQWLPQHYQCCMRRGYVKVVIDSAILKKWDNKECSKLLRAVAQTQKRGRVEDWCGGAFLRLDLLVTFGSSQK